MGVDAIIDEIVLRLRDAGIPIEAVENTQRLDTLEAKIGRKLPPSFRSLVNRYSFPVIDVGNVDLFSNAWSEISDDRLDDITEAPLPDPIMSEWLKRHGYMQIGRPSSGSYDPVCLDMKSGDDPAVVRLDHEDILLERKKVKSTVVAASFTDLMYRARA